MWERTASAVSDFLGSFIALAVAVVVVAAWLAFDWNRDDLNLVISITTLLMVFFVQASQNHDSKAFHLKLDDVVRAGPGSNRAAGAERRTDAELKSLAGQQDPEVRP